MKTTKKLIILLTACVLFGAQVVAAMALGEPSNVTGLTATAVDSSSIKLTWSAAKDTSGGAVSKYRVYYGTTSVFTAGKGDYDSKVDTKDNTTSYTASGLKAGTTYYFSVTAIDSKGIESAEYSMEKSAKTLATSSTSTSTTTTTTDKTSPTVTKVSAVDKTHVSVVFSEAVTLPTTSPQSAFAIKEQITTSKTLAVKSAKMDSTDTTNKTVILETADQTDKTNYIVTVGIAVKDASGNPIISGSSDSGLFTGSSVAATSSSSSTSSSSGTTSTPTTSTTTVSVIKDCVQSMTCFLPYLKDCSAASVDLVSSDNKYKYSLEITGTDTAGKNCLVKYTAEEHPDVLYDTTYMSCGIPKGTYSGESAYNLVFDIKNCTGTLANGYKAITASTTTTVKDTTPPENVTSLTATYKAQLKKFVVTLGWTASLNTAKDLADQLLYMSLDRGTTYGTGKSLGSSITKTDVSNLDGGKEYTFKITTKDKSGNESTGAIKSVRLPQTGMGIGLLLLGSIYGARRFMGRKKQ